MEDQSIITPILEALDYFNNSDQEIKCFYNIIDKFCCYWFDKKVEMGYFDNIELLLIHELLGEYIRFEKNNKRVALWLLAINRVCYNYNSNLSAVKEELAFIEGDKAQDIDTTLIEPILNHLKIYDDFQKSTGQEVDDGSDIFSTYLQWVMVYTTVIYPTLENKLDFKEMATLKAMNYILVEFIKQRSNDKRMAFLLMGIIEACRLYSLQHEEVSPEILDAYKYDDEDVLPGHEEDLVKEILNKLKDENEKNRENTVLSSQSAPESYLDESLSTMLNDLNSNLKLSVHYLNDSINKITRKFLKFNKEEKLLFLKKLTQIKFNKNIDFKPEIYSSLQTSIEHMSEKTRKWLKKESNENTHNIEYLISVATKIQAKSEDTQFQFSKPYIMLLILQSFELL